VARRGRGTLAYCWLTLGSTARRPRHPLMTHAGIIIIIIIIITIIIIISPLLARLPT
jgi:hypothetical protein